MLRQNGVGAGESGDRPRDASHSRATTARERHPLDGPIEQRGCRLCPTQNIAVTQPLAGGNHTQAHRSRRLTRRRGQLLGSRPRHGDDEVEPIQQRARHPLAVAGDPLRTARAVGRRIAAPAARAEIHRRHETKPGRKERMPANPGDRDNTVLERLA